MDQAYNTKKLFANTLKELLAEKPFDKIAVSELTKRCGVNRQTFYYHFETIIDLYKWVLQEEAGPLLFRITSDPYQWKDAVLEILYYIKANDSAVLSALRSVENLQIRASSSVSSNSSSVSPGKPAMMSVDNAIEGTRSRRCSTSSRNSSAL